MKHTFKDSYSQEESRVVISQIDHELKLQKSKVGYQPRDRKKGPAYIKARIQELENWKLHYQEKTI